MLGIASALERLLSIEDAKDVKWSVSTAASIVCSSSCSRTKRRF